MRTFLVVCALLRNMCVCVCVCVHCCLLICVFLFLSRVCISVALATLLSNVDAHSSRGEIGVGAVRADRRLRKIVVFVDVYYVD